MSTMTVFALTGPHDQTPRFQDVPVPSIGPTEILVEVKAIGVGIHDGYFLPPNPEYPYPIGIEAAGIVADVGHSVSGRSPGDRIAFISSLQPKGVVWAQYAAVDAAGLILPIPDGMSFDRAAAIPVAGNTALRALHALPSVPADGAIFVAGGSGAIGTFLLQLARAKGWEVAASSSPRNHDYLRALGAELAVDYNDRNWPEDVLQWRPDGLDGAIAIQPGTTQDSARVVRPGATVVTVSGDRATPSGARVTGLDYQVDVHAELVTLLDDIVAGEVRLELEQVYSFDEAPAALKAVGTRRARGKSVIVIS